MQFYARRVLSVKLSQYKPIRCMAACCLVAMARALRITPVNQTTLRRSIVQLLSDMGCVGTSEQEFEDMTRLLTTECVVCSDGFTICGVEQSLRNLSAPCCCDCKTQHKDIRVSISYPVLLSAISIPERQINVDEVKHKKLFV